MSAFMLMLLWFGAAFAFPFNPGQWGDGVPVADHNEGQTSADLVLENQMVIVAWQDDRREDPDLCVQVIEPDGRRVVGDQGRCLRRTGIQTNPILARDGLVFRESLDGNTWSVITLDRFGSSEERETLLSEDGGTVAELQAVSLPEGTLVSWVQTVANQRSIEAALVQPNSLFRWTICRHTGSNLADVQMVKNHELVFWTWTDWRDPLSAQLYVQTLDMSETTLLFEPNGLHLTPESEAAWMARPTPGERGNVLISYLERTEENSTVVRLQKLDAMGNFHFWPARILSEPSPLISSLAAASNETRSRVAWNNGSQIQSALLDEGGHRLAEDWRQTLPVNRIINVTITTTDSLGWVAWQDDRHGRFNETIVVQKLNTANQPLWEASGIEVSGNGHAKSRPHLRSQNDGVCIAAWEDYLTPEDNAQILLQRFE